MKGRLITIEGGEGAGKSSVMGALSEALERRGLEVVVAREPGGTAAGEAIRVLLLDPTRVMCAETELLLMFASRAQLVRETIAPALARGAWVICDRFTDASFAYQGGGRGLDAGIIAELERWVAMLKPDLTFLLDIDVRQGHARVATRAGERDRIESEREDFFERVRTTYRRRARAEPQRFRVIDAGLPAGEVLSEVLEQLDRVIAGWM